MEDTDTVGLGYRVLLFSMNLRNTIAPSSSGRCLDKLAQNIYVPQRYTGH